MRISIKLKDLKPNPFKKYINEGKLNEHKIEQLIESINRDGFWENVACRKNNGQYELSYGHHRIEAAKRVFGKEYKIDIHRYVYDDAAMLRILGNENNMQNEEFAVYQIDQVKAVKKFLENCPPTGRFKQTHKKEVGAREISEFLGGVNWGKSKVAELLRMSDSLHPKILKEVRNVANQGSDYEGISLTHGKKIATLPNKQDQLNVVDTVKKFKLSKRQTEALVKNVKEGKKVKIPEIKKSVVKLREDNIKQLVRNIEAKEIFFTCNSLIELIKKNPIKDFNEKDQEVLRQVYDQTVKKLLFEIEGQIIRGIK